ncbi:MAG: divalent metal cation transporter, partial [Steroidobacteraceae bacterium]
IDASIIGAMAVSLSTAYAIGDVLSLSHSLNRKPREAKVFYAVYAGLVAISAALVLAPGTPLGLITNAVQTLAGVLLPSATVFLLLLCNDREVLGPHVNGPGRNLLTGAIIAVLVALSLILTASVIFPDLGARLIPIMLGAGLVLGVGIGAAGFVPRIRGRMASAHGLGFVAAQARRSARATVAGARAEWRMPPLEDMAPAVVTQSTRLWMIVLRGYLVVAGGLVLARIVELALTGHSSWA